jgi:glucose/arabinose dehydrogenase
MSHLSVRRLLASALFITITIIQAPVARMQSDLPDGDDFAWVEVFTGLDSPLFLTHAGDGSGRLFVMEQVGFVLIIEDGALHSEPFLDVSRLISQDVHQGSYSERGLLGLAFHPDYATTGQIFINYTDENGHTVVARYTVMTDDPNRIDPASRTILFTVEQPFKDHNGGMMAFGRDGYLYIGVGDGGNANEPNYNSQDLTTLLGKILRIDVNADTYTIPLDNPFLDEADTAPEIWATGVRNPWRFSFDRATGDLYIGEVGQWTTEELNFVPADSPGGLDFGWSAFEGTKPYQEDVTIEGDVAMPFFEYEHQLGCSVTGGYVYRGAKLPELQGVYLFGDYCGGTIWSALRDESDQWQVEPFMETDFTISSFGEDEDGELYLVDYKGTIYRLEFAE